MDEGADDRGRVVSAEQPVALCVDSARRRGVEDDASTEGGLAAQHHAIAAGGDHRGCEPELRVRVPDADHTCRDAARPVMHREPRAVGDRRELLERHLEAVRPGECARRHEDIAAPEVAPLDAGKVDGNALAGLGTLDGSVVHLDGADADIPTRGLDP